MTTALDGVRVVDLTTGLAGPVAGMLLADLGADVIKVEEPDSGDQVRGIGPYYPGHTSHYFLAINRNKRSIAVDLKAAEGRQIIFDLAAQCDIVIENFRPAVMGRLGIGFEELRAVNPSLIFASIR